MCSLFPKLKYVSGISTVLNHDLYADKSKNLTTIAERFQANKSHFSLFPYWYHSANGFFKFVSHSLKRVAYVLFSKLIFFSCSENFSIG